jgi:hypothetical protein
VEKYGIALSLDMTVFCLLVRKVTLNKKLLSKKIFTMYPYSPTDPRRKVLD